MIVRENDAGATVVRRVDNDLPDREDGVCFLAGMTGKVKAAGLIVHVRNPQGFAGRILFGHATGKEPARSREAVELQREFGTLITHPA